MGCPVHIWLPAMAALAPAARIARDRFLALKPTPAPPKQRTLQRFAPISSMSAQPASSEAASTTEQVR